MRNVCVIKVTVCLLVSTEALLYVFGRRQTACCNVSEGNTITLLLCSLNIYLLFHSVILMKKEVVLKPSLLLFSCIMIFRLFAGKYYFCRVDVQAYTNELINFPFYKCVIPWKMLVQVCLALSGDLTR